jgi:CRP/FNR family cyclic AMP-dependent transcriptional regulator
VSGDVSESLGTDFLSALSAAEATDLQRRGLRRTFVRGQALLHEGQVADRIFILREGRVKITSTTAAGREVVLAFRARGELLGDLAALDGHPRSANVVALEPVELLALAPGDFSSFLADHPAAALTLLRIQSWRLREANVTQVEFAAKDALGRVAWRLLELSERFGEPHGEHLDIALPISQEELAGWVGASLESTARALQTMRSLGWIQTRRRSIRLLDPAAVRRAAG